MILHVVLFRPKSDVTAGDRDEIIAAIRTAAQTIPSVRQFQLGRRVLIKAGYESGMPDFPYAAIVQFDDVAGLRQYLAHPNHERLGGLFQKLQEAALVYDLEAGDSIG